MNIEEFTSGLAEKGISLSPRQLEQFELYYDMLVEWNEKINLTSITEKKEVYLKHFYDSITAAFYVDFNQVNTICDVGAGAGFPSLPIKICFPHLNVTIVDSLNKRITFLEKLSEALQLENTTFCHDRAETFGQRKDVRESYD
ncbi:16S rRNA (guanine(527)-N(7))-methyltransferase RsmG, partial [Bacillus sp. LR--39]